MSEASVIEPVATPRKNLFSQQFFQHNREVIDYLDSLEVELSYGRQQISEDDIDAVKEQKTVLDFLFICH
ncbi:hypothetical protein D5085_05140 [Ectothiorhodospiraceae bacterium BW-2]|nr:hypothetical protein D5085_05140 [Ectothiorhodospiraceae bacterium BW-2]